MLYFRYRFDNPWLLGFVIVAGLGVVPPARAQGAHSVAPAVATGDGGGDGGAAARRFPQTVRVGDLANRLVLEPSNHQSVLGRVDGVSRDATGRLYLVMRYGGVLGFGTRKIAVPLEATTLLGQFVQVVDVPQAELAAMPAFDAAAASVLGGDEVVRMGINRN